jgi:2-keto-4-pentenoate hydratase
MTLTNASITLAATMLAERRASAAQGPRLPEACRPQDIESALAIQAAVTARIDDEIGGWKCGLPKDGRVVMAPIYASTIYSASPCTLPIRAASFRIEPELAFILGNDLPAREAPYTPAEIDAAIVRTHLAFELIDSRYDNPDAASFPENLADGLLNKGLFIGPQTNSELARSASKIALRLSIDGSHEADLDGRHQDGFPRAPLYWLAEYLRSRGCGLRAGQAVITGSYAGSLAIDADMEISVQYGEMGTLTVRFISQ